VASIEGHWLGMTCAALDGPHGLEPRHYPRVALKAGEVRVGLRAAGVNFVDALITRGLYQYQPPLPFVPGLEAAGTVIECGPEVTDCAVGDRVIANAHTGMYATEVIAQAASLWRTPPSFSDLEAACFRVGTLTARHALCDRGRVLRGETVLVLGAGGGMGLAAVEIAQLLGATVIAAASSATRLRLAAARGAHHLVDYSSGTLASQVKAIAPGGVDAIFDPVGGTLSEESLRLCAWGGRLLAVGFASGVIGHFPANRLLLKGCSVIGVRAGEATRREPQLAVRSRDEILAWAERGHLRPHVSATFHLTEAASALAALENRTAVGRIALSIEP
jgi:NADPH2:quinone reductase